MFALKRTPDFTAELCEKSGFSQISLFRISSLTFLDVSIFTVTFVLNDGPEPVKWSMITPRSAKLTGNFQAQRMYVSGLGVLVFMSPSTLLVAISCSVCSVGGRDTVAMGPLAWAKSP